MAELLAYARANPAKVNYGHQGKGNTGHLLGELLMLKGGFRMTEIPYRGSAPAINDLLAGNYRPGARLSAGQQAEHRRRQAEVSGDRQPRARSKDYPSVADHRRDAARRLCRHLDGGCRAARHAQGDHRAKFRRDRAGLPPDADLKARILALEAEPLGSTPEQMRDMVRQSLETWGPVVEAAKISVE